MRTKKIAWFLLAGGLLMLVLPRTGVSQETPAEHPSTEPASQNGRFVVFDPPGAVCPNTYSYICTEAVGIDSSGDIAGYYLDAAGIEHGYFRLGNGKIYSFDAPGSNCFGGPGCTAASGITPTGSIVGSYYNGTTRVGFVRDNKGHFTTLEIPGATDVEPTAMNTRGDIAGYYYGANGILGFVRDVQGNYTSFNAAPGTGEGTYPSGINSHGEIVGTYSVSGWDIQAFLRCVDGTVTLLTFSDASSAYFFTSPGIDEVGQIVGSYDAGGNGDQDGFFRNTHGGYTGFSYPGASATVPVAINDSGAITGSYSLGTNNLGFYRLPDGSFGSFGPTGQGVTLPAAINALGAITGNYVDENYLTHAFAWKSH